MNKTPLKALALALCAIPSTSLAWDLRPDHLRVPLASYHINHQGPIDMQETNPGLALTWEGDFVDVTAGFYRNSFDNTSPFLTVSRDLMENDYCTAGVFVGASHYPEFGKHQPANVDGWIPLAGLQAECGAVFMQALPGGGKRHPSADGSTLDGVLLFGITMELNQ